MARGRRRQGRRGGARGHPIRSSVGPMRQLTSLDAQFLAIENGRNLGHVSGLSIYDPSTAPGGELTVDSMCAVLNERLHMLPPFRWRLAEVPLGLDHPYWIEDPDFDIEYHVRELALPKPGDDRQLAEQVARIHARALDRAHPLWELYVIQGLRKGRVGVFTKIHHAAIDGMSGAEILGVLLDPSPEGRALPPMKDGGPPASAPGQLEMLQRGLLGLPRQQLHALEAPRSKAPRTVFNGPVTSHRRVAFGTLSLTTVKDIKNATGTTVNDVVVT